MGPPLPDDGLRRHGRAIVKVTDVRLESYRWPRRKPIRNGRYVYPTSGLDVIKIDTDEGVTGLASQAGLTGRWA